jgi:hypothetical protein
MKVHELQGEEQPAVVQPIIRFQLSFYMQIWNYYSVRHDTTVSLQKSSTISPSFETVKATELKKRHWVK